MITYPWPNQSYSLLLKGPTGLLPYMVDPSQNLNNLLHVDGSNAGIILCMGAANERRRYIITSSLIGCAHTQNDPCSIDKVAYRVDMKS